MTTVTLRWSGPDAEEDAERFRELREQLREHGWLPDTARDELLRLVQVSEVVTGDPGDAPGRVNR